MNALHELTNKERGQILIDLFPDELLPTLEGVEHFCNLILVNEQKIRSRWDNPLFSASSWFNITAECLAVIKRLKSWKRLNARVFSEQLFYGYLSMVVIDCIIKFADSSEGRSKYKVAVDLLFKP